MIISLFTLHAWCDEPRDISEIDQKISLEFNKVDVKLLLNKFFREITKLDFVFDECVQGKLTITMIDVPAYDAFRLILSNAGLDYEQEGNVIRIYCKDASKTTDADSNESTTSPGIRAKVFASVKEKGEDESKPLGPGMEQEFPDGLGLWMIAPALPSKVPPVSLKTFDKDGSFIVKRLSPLEIMFTLKNLPPDGVEVKVAFSYSYAEYNDIDLGGNYAYRTISGTRQKLITSSNVDEPILLLAPPDGNEYYLSVIPEEWSK